MAVCKCVSQRRSDKGVVSTTLALALGYKPGAVAVMVGAGVLAVGNVLVGEDSSDGVGNASAKP